MVLVAHSPDLVVGQNFRSVCDILAGENFHKTYLGKICIQIQLMTRAMMIITSPDIQFLSMIHSIPSPKIYKHTNVYLHPTLPSLLYWINRVWVSVANITFLDTPPLSCRCSPGDSDCLCLHSDLWQVWPTGEGEGRIAYSNRHVSCLSAVPSTTEH